MLRRLERHVADLSGCRLCPGMQSAPITGAAVASRVMLVGQAPGDKEPALGRPFAWTAGRAMFKWFQEACGVDEAAFRARVYMTAVCRCFPGKKGRGGDRVPSAAEIANCARWLQRRDDPPAARAGHPRGQAGHRPVHRLRGPGGARRPPGALRLRRARLRRHPAAAPVRRLAVAARGARQDAAAPTPWRSSPRTRRGGAAGTRDRARPPGAGSVLRRRVARRFPSPRRSGPCPSRAARPAWRSRRRTARRPPGRPAAPRRTPGPSRRTPAPWRRRTHRSAPGSG